ncbi:MAG: hypothetical protein JRF02_05570 [Deltaproteobacteria bacterium]|jgi:hypothetical protein|nr:hypothetical protein [Deltaproteobacteria bacterium]
MLCGVAKKNGVLQIATAKAAFEKDILLEIALKEVSYLWTSPPAQGFRLAVGMALDGETYI